MDESTTTEQTTQTQEAQINEAPTTTETTTEAVVLQPTTTESTTQAPEASTTGRQIPVLDEDSIAANSPTLNDISQTREERMGASRAEAMANHAVDNGVRADETSQTEEIVA